jgi:membrane protease YdiL (CAAX protease family)
MIQLARNKFTTSYGVITIKILKKHKLTAYLITTFLFTWTFWIIAFTSNNLSLNGSFRIIGSFFPSIMSIIFTSYYYGTNGIKKLLRNLTIWKVNPLIYAFIFLYTAASLYVPSFICSILGLNYKIQIANHISSFKLTSPITTVICFIAIMIFGGPLGEELGWRGFVLPKLKKKFNPVISSIILGFIWTFWHAPMFYFRISGYNVSFIVYLLETIWLTTIFTWLYNNTKGSLLIIILYHSFDNFVMSICFNNFMDSLNTYTVIFWILRLIVLLWIIYSMNKKMSKNAIF